MLCYLVFRVVPGVSFFKFVFIFYNPFPYLYISWVSDVWEKVAMYTNIIITIFFFFKPHYFVDAKSVKSHKTYKMNKFNSNQVK